MKYTILSQKAFKEYLTGTDNHHINWNNIVNSFYSNFEMEKYSRLFENSCVRLQRDYQDKNKDSHWTNSVISIFAQNFKFGKGESLVNFELRKDKNWYIINNRNNEIRYFNIGNGENKLESFIVIISRIIKYNNMIELTPFLNIYNSLEIIKPNLRYSYYL